MSESKDAGTALQQQTGPITNMFQQPCGALGILQDRREDVFYLAQIALSTVTRLHLQRDLAARAKLFLQGEVGKNTPPLDPIMQQSFDAQLVEDCAILRKLPALKNS
jgi:hypothetical protein